MSTQPTPMLIKFSDDQRQPHNSFLIDPGQVDTSLTFTLYGEGTNIYGELTAQALLNTLEHFNSPTPPERPTEGQMWYNPTSKELNIGFTLVPYIAEVPANTTINQPNPIPAVPAQIGWRAIGAPIVSSVPILSKNSLWFEDVNHQTYLNNELNEWESLGRQYIPLVGSVGIDKAFRGDLELDNTTLALQVDDKLVGKDLVINAISTIEVLSISDSIESNQKHLTINYQAGDLLGAASAVPGDTMLLSSNDDINITAPVVEFIVDGINTMSISPTTLTVGDNIELSMQGNKIENLTLPVQGTDAVRFDEYDTIVNSINNAVLRVGDTMDTGSLIELNNNDVTLIPTSGESRLKFNDQGELGYNPNQRGIEFRTYGSKLRTYDRDNDLLCEFTSTSVYSNSLKMYGNAIKLVGSPVVNSHGANKRYVDLKSAAYTSAASTASNYGPKGHCTINLYNKVTQYGWNCTVSYLSNNTWRITWNTSGLYSNPSSHHSTPIVGTVVGSVGPESNNSASWAQGAAQSFPVRSYTQWHNSKPASVITLYRARNLYTQIPGNHDYAHVHHMNSDFSATLNQEINIAGYW